jgi:hypothetical protein
MSIARTAKSLSRSRVSYYVLSSSVIFNFSRAVESFPRWFLLECCLLYCKLVSISWLKTKRLVEKEFLGNVIIQVDDKKFRVGLMLCYFYRFRRACSQRRSNWNYWRPYWIHVLRRSCWFGVDFHEVQPLQVRFLCPIDIVYLEMVCKNYRLCIRALIRKFKALGYLVSSGQWAEMVHLRNWRVRLFRISTSSSISVTKFFVIIDVYDRCG